MQALFGPNANAILTSLATKAKALAAGVTEIELKVLEATNEDKWGPHGNDMKEIARATEEPEKRALVMGIIWQRLQETEENWRLCYKCLLLCEYLIKQGPPRVVGELQRSSYVFERLRDNFYYKDADGRDQGINVRQRARELATLLSSEDKIKEEREKARINANKYKGVSAADMARGYGGSYGGGGYGSSNSGGYGNNGNGGGSQGYGHSSSMSRTSGGGGGGGNGGSRGWSESGAGGGGGRGGDEDPFEATRRRIERLKAQGELQEGPGSRGAAAAEQDTGPQHVPSGSINMDAPANLFPELKPRMGPKKLSEVKVDATIAGTLNGAVGLAPPPPAGSTVKSSLGRAPAPGAATTNTNSSLGGLDLLDVGGPAASSAPADATDSLEWDAFSDPVPPVSSTSQPRPAASNAFDLLAGDATPAPTTSKPATASQPIDLFAFDSTPAQPAMPAPAAPKPAPAVDLFDDPFGPMTSAPPPAAQAPPAQPSPSASSAFDPFAPVMSAPVTTSAASVFDDPFTPFTAAPPAAAAPAAAQGLNANLLIKADKAKPVQSKKSDPFADLAGLL